MTVFLDIIPLVQGKDKERGLNLQKPVFKDERKHLLLSMHQHQCKSTHITKNQANMITRKGTDTSVSDLKVKS